MKDLIEALTIFSKYTDEEYVTCCEHDVLYVIVDPAIVSAEDKARLNALGFIPSRNDTFLSYRYGSC